MNGRKSQAFLGLTQLFMADSQGDMIGSRSICGFTRHAISVKIIKVKWNSSADSRDNVFGEGNKFHRRFIISRQVKSWGLDISFIYYKGSIETCELRL